MSTSSTGATPLGRRVVLGGLTGTLGLLAVGMPRRADAAPTLVRVTALGGDTWVTTSATGAASVPTVLGARLAVLSRAVPAGARVTLSWDDRLYGLASPSVLTAQGRPVDVRTDASGPGGRGTSRTITLTLGEELLAGQDYVLVVGARRLRRYPHDLVDDPLPTEIEISARSEPSSTSRFTAAGTSHDDLWGVAVGVGWEAVRWGSGFHSWLPGLVTIRSVGPDSVPARTAVTVSLDGRLFRGVDFDRADGHRSVRSVRVRQDEIVQTRWVLDRELPAGERASATVTASRCRPTGSLDALHPPLVSARAPRQGLGQRLTGQESATREDSAFDQASRATFGLDLSARAGHR